MDFFQQLRRKNYGIKELLILSFLDADLVYFDRNSFFFVYFQDDKISGVLGQFQKNYGAGVMKDGSSNILHTNHTRECRVLIIDVI